MGRLLVYRLIVAEPGIIENMVVRSIIVIVKPKGREIFLLLTLKYSSSSAQSKNPLSQTPNDASD